MLFSRFVKEMDLADPNFADFRPYSANIIFMSARYDKITYQALRRPG